MMKATLIATIIGAFAGWFGYGFLSGHESGVASNEADTKNNVSLLGARAPTKGALPSVETLGEFDGLADFLLRLDEASDEEIKHWLKAIHEDQELRYQHWQLINVVAGSWARRDPEAAMAFAREHELSSLYEAILKVWAPRDMAAAYDASMKLAPNGRYAHTLLQGLSPDQLDAGYEFLLEQGLDKTQTSMFGNVFATLYRGGAEKAANRAVAHLLNQGRHEFRHDHGLGNVLRKWLQDDPEAAVTWAQALENRTAREGVMARITKEWMKTDPVGGMERFWGDLNYQQRQELVDSLQNEGLNDVDSLLEWVDQNMESLEWSGKILSNVTMGLRNSENPERLAELLPRLDSDSGQDERAVRDAATKWAAKDEDAVKAWIETIEDDKFRDAATKGWLKHLVRDDPVAAIAQAEVLGEDGSYDVRSIISGAFRQIQRTGELTPQELMARMPEGIRDVAAMSYAERQAERAPAETMAFLREQSEGEERDRALQYTAGHWAASEPDRVADWVETLEDESAREYAMRNLVNTWSRYDVNAAAEWVQQRPASSGRDEALKELVNTTMAHAPEKAFAWATEIEGGSRQEQAVQKSLTALARIDPDKAAELLGSVSVHEDTQKTVEKEIAFYVALRDLTK